MVAYFVASNFAYPPTEGLQQHTLTTLAMLRSAGVAVELYGFVKNPGAVDHGLLLEDQGLGFAVPPIVCASASLLTGIRMRQPFDRFRSAAENDLLARLRMGKFSVLHLDGAGACGLIRKAYAKRAVVSLVDPGSRRYWRLARQSGRGRQGLRYLVVSAAHFVFEATLYPRLAVWHFVSSSDLSFVRRAHGCDRAIAIPIALAEIGHQTASKFHSRQPDAGSCREYLVVYGDLGRPDMRVGVRWLFERIFGPDDFLRHWRIVVLGRVVPADDLGAAAAGLDIEFLPRVDNYLDILGRASVVILPDVVGTGLKTRAIQCMGLGLVVAGTSIAFEGIDAASGLDAIVADDPEELRRLLSGVLRSVDRRNAMGIAAARFATESYSSDAVSRKWSAVYDDIDPRCHGRV